MNRTSFVLDPATRDALRRLSQRLEIPQAEVVRRSIRSMERRGSSAVRARQQQIRRALDNLAAFAGRRTAAENTALRKQLREDRLQADQARP